MGSEKRNLDELFGRVTEYFSPRIVGAVDGVYIKVVRVKGQDVPWHTHDGQDEMFFVAAGALTVELEGRDAIVLNAGEFVIVEHGMRHRVFSEEECRVMLVENKDTEHTGDVRAPITKSIAEQLDPGEP
jgi:quercetin dioxygenase-like cupin family protein